LQRRFFFKTQQSRPFFNDHIHWEVVIVHKHQSAELIAGGNVAQPRFLRRIIPGKHCVREAGLDVLDP
jgi:hypothetical protein